jgi:8-oxo-dGTP diphosphatase
MDQPVIRIAAALAVDDAGRILLVRKRGTRFFMQAGGKIEATETSADALIRELAEELDVSVHPGTLEHLGRFVARAANEEGHLVEAEIFHVRVPAAIFPSAEIEEVLWIDPAADIAVPLAPLTRDHVLPLARQVRRRTREDSEKA